MQVQQLTNLPSRHQCHVVVTQRIASSCRYSQRQPVSAWRAGSAGTVHSTLKCPGRSSVSSSIRASLLTSTASVEAPVSTGIPSQDAATGRAVTLPDPASLHISQAAADPSNSVCRPNPTDSAWIRDAISRLRADAHRSADTHLFAVDLPAFSRHGVDFYLKDESSHPTGSLKHRLARSLFMYGLVNHRIHPDTVLVEASSGSTAVSEAYFARKLGLKFIAVMAKTVSQEKIAAIEHFGGRCHLVESTCMIYSEAERLAEGKGFFLNQFKNAEVATDWRGNNNIAELIFEQMERERFPEPAWVVVSAGTGGTSTTIGRYLRYHGASTQLCVADPENSVFYDAWRTGDRSLTNTTGSMVEGIGRPRVEASFMPQLVDDMIKVPDVDTFATMRCINKLLGRKVGGSTGTNCYAALRKMCDMVEKGEKGSVVSLICDSGERYSHTYYNDEWLQSKGFELGPHEERIKRICDTAEWIE